MPFEIRQATVETTSPHLGGRLDRLVQELAGGARSHVAGLFDHDCVKLNGELTREMAHRLIAGDVVQVRYEVGRRYHARPKPRPHHGFAVVHEDRDLIVVDKAPELLTVPTERGEPNTLVDRVHEYVKRTKSGSGAFPAHRLDRGVSGLLIMGKSPEMAERIRDQFAARKPERKYAALVAGDVQPATGVFRTYLATDKALNRYSTDDMEVGQLAVTHYRVLERLGDVTYVEVWLETGRRNQIRVHFSEVGHPVLGDPRYRAEQAAHRWWPYSRIALHARTLGLEHPRTGELLRFEAALPAEMACFLQRARGGGDRPAASRRKRKS